MEIRYSILIITNLAAAKPLNEIFRLPPNQAITNQSACSIGKLPKVEGKKPTLLIIKYVHRYVLLERHRHNIQGHIKAIDPPITRDS